MNVEARLIEFPKIGRSEIGYLSIAEQANGLPFQLNRVFWTYYTPESIVRGRHAHYKNEMVLVAASGRILVNTEDKNGHIGSFVLDSPQQGVYIPPMCWHTMQYSHSSVQLVLCSMQYDEADYIRSYDDFLRKRDK